MGSLFVPDTYKLEPVSSTDTKLASVAWGFTLGFGFLTAVKAATQTVRIWRRRKHVTTYMILTWGELVVSTIFGFLCWFFMNRSFPPSFAFFFSILTLWVIQVQFLLQIIINRIALLMPDKRKVWYLKWGVAALISAVNISVYCIWIPARLQISERYIHINEIWDRIEKGIYLIVDALLNAYFLRLVKTRLISGGMLKYQRLFNFNAAIVLVSLSMDVLIIAMMSLPNTFVYMMFHPVAYIVKLNIEMSMADLITKVARYQDSGADPSYSGPSSHGQSKPNWGHGRMTAGHGHNRMRSAEPRAVNTSKTDWETFGTPRDGGSGTEYKTEIHATGHTRPDYSKPKDRKADGSRVRGGVFDDSNESRGVDFADMMREDSNVIVKTVEVQVSANADHPSDSESTMELQQKDRT